MENSINNNSSSNILENMNMTMSKNSKSENIAGLNSDQSFEFQNLLKNLNELGEKGWDLVSLEHDIRSGWFYTSTLYLKRKLKCSIRK